MPSEPENALTAPSGSPKVIDELLKRVLAAYQGTQYSKALAERIRTRSSGKAPIDAPDSRAVAEPPSCYDRHWLACYYPIGPGTQVLQCAPRVDTGR